MNTKHYYKITAPTLPWSEGLLTLVGMAIGNPEMEALLLADPLAAARLGYEGEAIEVRPEEESLLLAAAGVGTLDEFCRRLLGLESDLSNSTSVSCEGNSS